MLLSDRFELAWSFALRQLGPCCSCFFGLVARRRLYSDSFRRSVSGLSLIRRSIKPPFNLRTLAFCVFRTGLYRLLTLTRCCSTHMKRYLCCIKQSWTCTVSPAATRQAKVPAKYSSSTQPQQWQTRSSPTTMARMASTLRPSWTKTVPETLGLQLLIFSGTTTASVP